jgi:putative ABC transport system permease protein
MVALALVLLTAAGLLGRSAHRLSHVDPGFDARSRLVFEIGLPRSSYRTRGDIAGFHERVLEAVGQVPGARSVALATTLPLEGRGQGQPLVVRGSHATPAQTLAVARFRRVSDSYFDTMRIPLRRGRTLDARDVDGRTGAAVINETLAQQYFRDQDPIGREIRQVEATDDYGWLTIVGVVGDTPTDSLREVQSTGKVYLPIRGYAGPDVPGTRQVTYVVHTAGEPIALLPEIRRVIGQLDGSVPLAQVTRLSDIVATSNADVTFGVLVFALSASVALLLGLVGVWGIVADLVVQRTPEIGVRLALGARPAQVVRMVATQTAGAALTGGILGLAATVPIAPLLGAWLFEVRALDAPTYSLAAGTVLVAVAIACWWPARRAAAIDPARAMRAD